MTLTCELPPCPEHDHCAYHGTEDGRCPWCHVQWETITVRGSHSCEQAKTWPSEQRKLRVSLAVRNRKKAAERLYAVESATFCPHVESGSI